MENRPIKTYRDLVVWQKAHALAKLLIAACSQFPANDEGSVIKKQLLRSCTSIPANIAEGFGGSGGKVFRNSLIIARREATETDYWILLSHELGLLRKEVYDEACLGYGEVRMMLSALIRKVSPADSQ
jgi:four helix bundle protein